MKQFISNLRDGENVTSIFMVGEASLSFGKTGKSYLNMTLVDKSGEVDARMWDGAEDCIESLSANSIVSVEGRCQLFQGRKQVIINRLRVADATEVDVSDLSFEPPLDPEMLYEELVSIIESMRDPHYKALAEAFFIHDSFIRENIKVAPAAKSIHHAYPSGLLDHMISILKTLDFISMHYSPYLDRDLLLLGGMFHDVGKLWELDYSQGATEYSLDGRLLGHLVMGVEKVQEKVLEIEQTPGSVPVPFPEEKVILIKHLILSHHGQLEYGSPKRPKCLEAFIVHAIDDLDSKVSAIKSFLMKDPSTDKFTYLNKQFGRYFFKPDWARSIPPGEI